MLPSKELKAMAISSYTNPQIVIITYHVVLSSCRENQKRSQFRKVINEQARQRQTETEEG
ncbi:hypothetical protein C0Q70_13726 [Pomacea canaliculata]|uniref:Uncharacterized protein n=1 Tax=Pomacea canaliculata TaxID=400727 RepID=A0A2T7NY02_POMCA|nr:hypothetical protein C0Q70_13726 [Pomacea canaliculata]